MRPILAGIETEYGLHIEGRGAEDQIEDSMALVRHAPDGCFVGWDYRTETPRKDLRGFQLSHLTADPTDAAFDRGKNYGSDRDVRSDRVLPNGARFYNDHGHPEYSTPECRSLRELALHDAAGAQFVLSVAQRYAEAEDREVRVYKNNTDYHGASYGTHESYLVPRGPVDSLIAAVTPMLVARTILCGAGKVGAETGRSATYQLSQRADFFMEPVNAETLYRRPIFNTRDEPHAEPARWIRLHVISGDANMISAATVRKIGLVKLALHLREAGTAPTWRFKDPVAAIQSISRDESGAYEIELEGRSWTNAQEVIESYLAAAEQTLDLDPEFVDMMAECRELLEDVAKRQTDAPSFRRRVDWAAKRYVLEQALDDAPMGWQDPVLRSYDLEYHNVDPQSGLHAALVEMEEAAPEPEMAELEHRWRALLEPTRAAARAVAVQNFRAHLLAASWGRLTFQRGESVHTVDLEPDRDYPLDLQKISDVESFIRALEPDA